MAELKKTETVRYHTFRFTEQEVERLQTALGTCTSGDLVSLYKTFKDVLNQPQEG